VADPQVPDWRSYSDRPWLLNTLTRIVIDNYARKVWRRILATHMPEAIFFLGDLLDSGVHVTDSAELVTPSLLLLRPVAKLEPSKSDTMPVCQNNGRYERYLARFRNIFELPRPPVPVFYLAGNHDVGLVPSPGGVSASDSTFARDRFRDSFGPLNGEVQLGNHSVVWIDATRLLQEMSVVNNRADARHPTVDFVKNLAGSEHVFLR
jgi:ethanolamine phosphate phosphodiesterase